MNPGKGTSELGLTMFFFMHIKKKKSTSLPRTSINLREEGRLLR